MVTVKIQFKSSIHIEKFEGLSEAWLHIQSMYELYKIKKIEITFNR